MKTRECKKCHEIKFFTTSFTNKANPNICSECISIKQKERRRLNGADPARHWKKTGFGDIFI
mgnify:CR=1 FL=1